MRQNYFDGKEWYPPPLSILTFFDTRNVLKNRRVPLRNISVLWDKIFDIKSWYSLPPSPPLLSIKFFDTRNFVKHRRFPLRSFSVLWDKRFSTENRDILLLGIKFFDTWNFLRHRRVPLRNDSVLRQNYFDGKSWYPPPFSTLTFFDTRNFPKQGFPHEIFRHCETKILT